MPVHPFNAAKDLVYTINGGEISSGGYRINKLLGTNLKKGRKQKQSGGKDKPGDKPGGKHVNDEDNSYDFFKEDTGIPIGLLLLQSNHKYITHDNNNDHHSKSHHDDDDDDGNGNALIIVPSPMGMGMGATSAPAYSEDPVHICSREVDDELYDTLLNSASYSESSSESKMHSPSMKKNDTKLATRKRHFGAHLEKVFQKRKTKSKRRG